MNTLKILVTSQKGGVGKSTIAANIAAYFATLLRKQVTLIDFDHQGTSSTWVRRAPVPNLQIKICDVLSVRDAGPVMLKAKQALRDSIGDAHIVVGDLTWVDVFPPALFFDYDLVLVPTSMSRIELASTMDFVGRFATVFNASHGKAPRLVLVPSRLVDGEDYRHMFKQANFPVRFSLSTPVPFSTQAQESFGSQYLFDTDDLSLRDGFTRLCGEIESVMKEILLERSNAVKVLQPLRSQVRTGGGASILDRYVVQREARSPAQHAAEAALPANTTGLMQRFKSKRTAGAPVAPVANSASDSKWFGFLRRQS